MGAAGRVPTAERAVPQRGSCGTWQRICARCGHGRPGRTGAPLAVLRLIMPRAAQSCCSSRVIAHRSLPRKANLVNVVCLLTLVTVRRSLIRTGMSRSKTVDMDMMSSTSSSSTSSRMNMNMPVAVPMRDTSTIDRTDTSLMKRNCMIKLSPTPVMLFLVSFGIASLIFCIFDFAQAVVTAVVITLIMLIRAL